ncbi:hypothetical protein N1027_11820 [Herbiconiux sp. CPCC 205763]|uniref:Uncharacterized protein n=1 Tax=Herbiconiux aconitum TaxID=2970913 RepID=A0ABT2GRH3_9MICO|nr:hypothetical protein [Herbiconiux aconitum]MCS5718822.1 hypothetical protein [Herbiconiux aconitum]
MKVGRRLLIVGAAMIILSAALVVGIPTVGYSVLDASTQSGQGALVTIEVIVRFLASVLPAFGAALMAAGITVNYLELRASDETA